MRVKCVLLHPTEQDIKKLGDRFHGGYILTLGKVYTVLGISFSLGHELLWNGVGLDIVDDDGNLVIHPMCLFEIVDGRPSRYWEARADEVGIFDLKPPSFYRDYYNEDIFDGVAEVVEDFNRVRGLIEAEASEAVKGRQ